MEILIVFYWKQAAKVGNDLLIKGIKQINKRIKINQKAIKWNKNQQKRLINSQFCTIKKD